MKKILLFAFVAIIGTFNVDAQRRGGERKTPEQIVERLDSKLDLTDEQEKQITELYKDFFSQKLSREDMKSKKEELDTKISSLLNDEQKVKFENIRKSGKKK